MLRTLINRREKRPLCSKDWWKSWAKRAHSLPCILSYEWHAWRFRLRGGVLGAGSVLVDHGGIVGDASFVSIGKSSFVGRIHMAAHAKVVIGSNVCINDGAKLLAASHDISSPRWAPVSRDITIGDFAWLATDCIVLPGVCIGVGAVVGAGAVVAKDVPDHCVAVGNPARIMERRRIEQLDYQPTEFLAAFRAWLGSSESAE